MQIPFKKVRDYIASPARKRTVSILGILILIAAIPLTVLVAQKQQELRQRAATNDIGSYPKPPQDTGIGFHWSAQLANGYDPGTAQNAACQLREMGFSWVKIIADGTSALDFARIMKQNGIEPIVRLYRPTPLPGTLPQKDLDAVPAYVSAGVNYFESTNEPNVSVEWQGQQIPDPQTAVTQTMQAWVQDALHIQQRGGFPLFPGLSPGGTHDDIGFLRDSFTWLQSNSCQLANGSNGSCLELFDAGKSNGKPAVMNIHNYNLNHDNSRNPDGSIQFYTQDSNAFLKFITYDNIVKSFLGRSVPILATEDGMIIGEQQDNRYPATDENWHKDVTVAMANYQMNNTTPYFFNTAFWLSMPNPDGFWQESAWLTTSLTPKIPGTIDALKAMPKRTRTGGAYSTSCGPIATSTPPAPTTIATPTGFPTFGQCKGSFGNLSFACGSPNTLYANWDVKPLQGENNCNIFIFAGGSSKPCDNAYKLSSQCKGGMAITTLRDSRGLCSDQAINNDGIYNLYISNGQQENTEDACYNGFGQEARLACFGGEPETIDTLDFFLSKHQNQGLTGKHPFSQTVDGEKLYMVKWDPKNYEIYTWDNNYVYLRADNSGAPNDYYSYAPGNWMKRQMKIGEKVESTNNRIQVYNSSCQPVANSSNNDLHTGPFPFSVTLESHNPKFNIGGELGIQDVITLKYDSHPNWVSGAGVYERVYYSREWGWILWEEYQKETNLLSNSSIFNQLGSKIDPDKNAVCDPSLRPGNPTLTPTPSTTATTPSPTKAPNRIFANLSLILKGIGNGIGFNTNPKTTTKQVTLCFYDQLATATNDPTCQNALYKPTGNIVYDAASRIFRQNNFDLGIIPPGNYQVFIKTDKYLRKRIPGIISILPAANNVSIPTTTLIVGDINGDNIINIQDYSAYLDCFGNKQNTSSCRFRNNVDLNDDGKIDTTLDLNDYRLLLQSFASNQGD